MDAVFGGQTSDLDATNSADTSTRDSSSGGLDGNTDGANLRAAANVTGDASAAASVEIPLGPASENGESPDNSGAIVITVNYMFMEGGDQGNGRTGSLVVTLPNNATNREPRIILLFISLATRMAYSALVTNAPKLHPGVTLDKFNSFAFKAASELADSACSICFESYDIPPETPEMTPAFPLETIASKKRKLGINSHSVSATSSTERLPDTMTDSDPVASAPPSSASGSESTTEGDNEESRPKYLCEHDEDYGHLPVQMPCGHVFGQSCLYHWLKENTSCPLCRVSVAEAPQRPQGTPISYIRFGGLNNSTDDLTAPLSGLGGENSTDTPRDDTPRDETTPGLFDRTRLGLFNIQLAAPREAPPPPLIPSSSNSRARNSAVSPVIQNILSYFGRPRRQREDSSGENSLFASGVSSRRTADGVETVTSDHLSPTESFHDFTSLTGHRGGESNDEQATDNASTSGGENNNAIDHSSNEDNTNDGSLS